MASPQIKTRQYASSKKFNTSTPLVLFEGRTEATKRRYSDHFTDPLAVAAKRPRMNKDDMDYMVRQFKAEGVKIVMSDEDKKEIISGISSEVKDDLSNRMDSLEARLEKVKAGGSALSEEARETLKSDICQQVSTEMQTNIRAGMDLNLMQQVNESEKNILVFGYKCEALQQGLFDLGKLMKIPEEKMSTIRIVQAFRLGKPKSKDDVKPICYKLGSAYNRNTLMEYSKNLPEGVRFDIDTPLVYRKIHEDLKAAARDYREFENLKTSIRFNQHALTLRIRQNNDEQWCIADEQVPSADAIRKATIKGTQQGGGQKPHIPDPEQREKSTRTVRIGNIKEEHVQQVHTLVGDVVKSPLSKSMGPVAYKKNAAHLLCTDTQSAIEIQKLCSAANMELDGKRLTFRVFKARK